MARPIKNTCIVKKITFEQHKQLVLDFFSEVIIQDDMFYQTLEEKTSFGMMISNWY